MSTATGRCYLCLEEAELQRSHLLPAALYDRVRSPEEQNVNPVVLSDKSHIQISNEAQRHLLCSRCEQRFQQYGEDWVLKNSAFSAGRFKLREVLLRGSAEDHGNDLWSFSAHAYPSVNVDSICYFAISVIWRASVSSWKIGDAHIPKINLGEYEEPTRLFLLGKEDFPPNTTVRLMVSSLKEVWLISTFPETEPLEEYDSHSFSIPGMHFKVEMGTGLLHVRRETCIRSGSPRRIYYSPIEDLNNAERLARQRSELAAAGRRIVRPELD